MNKRIGSRAVAWRGAGQSPAKKFSIFWLFSKHFAAYAYAEVFEGAYAYTEFSELEYALRIPPPWSSSFAAEERDPERDDCDGRLDLGFGSMPSDCYSEQQGSLV